jgi:hypothetical protein
VAETRTATAARPFCLEGRILLNQIESRKSKLSFRDLRVQVEPTKQGAEPGNSPTIPRWPEKVRVDRKTGSFVWWTDAPYQEMLVTIRSSHSRYDPVRFRVHPEENGKKRQVIKFPW